MSSLSEFALERLPIRHVKGDGWQVLFENEWKRFALESEASAVARLPEFVNLQPGSDIPADYAADMKRTVAICKTYGICCFASRMIERRLAALKDAPESAGGR